MKIYALLHTYWAAGYDVEALYKDKEVAERQAKTLNDRLDPILKSVQSFKIEEYDLYE